MSTSKLSASIASEQKQELDAIAERKGISTSQAVAEAVQLYIKHQEQVVEHMPEFSRTLLLILLNGGEAGMLPEEIAKAAGYNIKRTAAVLGSLMTKGLVSTDGTSIMCTPDGYNVAKKLKG